MARRLMTLAVSTALSLNAAACGKKADPAAADAATAATAAGPDAAAAATGTADAAASTTDGAAAGDAAAGPADAGSAPDASAATAPDAPAPAQVAGSLTPAGVDARRPRVSPDGRRVLYHAGKDGAHDVFVMDADGQNARAIAADPADDRDPSWAADGKRVIFASNRGGAGHAYDLYVVDVSDPARGDGATALAVGKAGADATEPSLSPLRYSFSAVNPDSCSGSGANGVEVDSYEKVVFTRGSGDQREVWFRSVKGPDGNDFAHEGRISPAGTACWGARFSGDGLSLAMTCADKAGGPDRRVVHDMHAAWDQSFEAALGAIDYKSLEFDDEGKQLKGPKLCDQPEDAKAFADDACLKALPRRYATYAPAPIAGGDALELDGYATNQTLVLAHGAAGAMTRERTSTAAWAPLEGGDAAFGAFDWSPDGQSVVAEKKRADGTSELVRLPTQYYLQDVKDLVAYPELWGGNRSERMQKNRFVVHEGREKEFFTAYDKTMYARRAAFVTTDATMQIVRDEFAELLKHAEESAAGELMQLSEGLMKSYAARPDSPTNRFYTRHFAVAWAVLAAADAVATEDANAEPRYPGDDEERPADKPPIDRIKAKLPEVLKALPATVKAETKEALDKALAHEGFIEVNVPGLSQPAPVDFSQMKPRGHYAESSLAGYFVALKWLGMVPFALDASAIDLVRTMEKEDLVDHWKKVDGLIGAFMGKPVDITVSHVQAQLEEDASFLEPTFDKVKAGAAFKKKLGELGIRGLGQALADDEGKDAPAPEMTFMLFPLRLGADVPTFKALTHPDVQNRGLPSALDVFAALDVPAAVRAAIHESKGQEWQAAYEASLGKLRNDAPGRDDALWSSDLYHGWLALLRRMATPRANMPSARLAFADNDAWADRLVSGALAGYAQLKHDAVLYAFQDFSAQCDSGYMVMVYVEQPILPYPAGFVEPNPEFFREAAAFAKKTYEVFLGEGNEPAASGYYEGSWEDPKEVVMNGRVLAERLEAIAQAEVDRQEVTQEQLDFIRTIGGTMEAIFLAQDTHGATGESSGAGRQERGVALVSDIHTNVTSQVALTVGIGRVDKIFVAVPDRVGARMTEGGVFSFYETTQPISDRLTDEQWNERIVQGTLPARPTWVASFFEKGPPPPPEPKDKDDKGAEPE